MPEVRILIVEDDGIIGRHIQSILSKLGYNILDVLATGLEAVQAAEHDHPDLVLMDISLEGDLDGIEAARQIHDRYDIPVVFVTAYADDATLQRAKEADPFGYILKPFDEYGMHIAIEMAINKSELTRRLRESEERFRTLVDNTGEGVGIADPNEVFQLVNPAAEEIFGVPPGGLTNHSLKEFTRPEVYKTIRAQTSLRRKGKRSEYELEIQRPDGQTRLLSITATPWFDKKGAFAGAFGIFRDVTEQRKVEQAEREQRTLAEALRDTAATLNRTLDIDEVFDRILANVGQVVPHDSADIVLIEGDSTRVVRSRGYEKHDLEKTLSGVKFKVSQVAKMEQMVVNGEPVVIPDVRKFPGWIVNPGFEWLLSIVRAPIRVKGETVGFLTLNGDVPGYFNQTHAERLKAFADQAAIAIENARLFEDIRQRARYLALLNELTQAALRGSDYNEMLQSIGGLMVELYDADQVCITVWNEEKQVTETTSVLKRSGESESGISPRPCENVLTSMVLAARDVLAFEDTDNIKFPDDHAPITFMMHSVMGLPLIAGEHKLGAVLVGFEKSHVFKPEEIAWGEQTGGQIALAIHKERLFSAERRKTLQLTHANALVTGLARVAARIASASGIDAIMKTLGNELSRIGLKYILVMADPDTNDYQIRSITLEPARLKILEKASGIKLDQIQMQIRNSAYYERLIEKREAVYNPDISKNITEMISGLSDLLPGPAQEFIEVPAGTGGMYLPLFIGERALGLLVVWSGALEATDLATMTIFASQVAISLDNARLYSEVQQQAITDELTGLYNRRGIFEFGQEEIKRARRSSTMPSLILLDIDFFKRVNDSYGHDTGDEVIRSIAGRCRRNLREIDIMGRYGGEGGDEFVIVLPDTDLDGARLVAERLRQVIGDSPVMTDSGPVNITVSLGVSNLRDDASDWESLLSRADLAMYAAKAAGRNCVMVN